jgi:hypothetical protein
MPSHRPPASLAPMEADSPRQLMLKLSLPGVAGSSPLCFAGVESLISTTPGLSFLYCFAAPVSVMSPLPFGGIPINPC